MGINSDGRTESLNVQSVLFTLGEEKKNSPRIRAMVEATEQFAERKAKNNGLSVIRKFASAEELNTPIASYESKGIGFYRVAFSVDDKAYTGKGEKIDFRFGRTKRDFLNLCLEKIGLLLSRIMGRYTEV